MPRNTLYALGGGAASAVLYLVLPLGALFAALPLLLAGLALGTRPGTIAAVAGLVIVSLLMGPFVGGLYAILYGIPALVVMRQTLLHRPGPAGPASWYAAGGIISALSATGMAMVLIGAVAAALAGESLSALLREATSQRLAEMGAMVPGLDDGAREAIIDRLSPFSAGLACTSFLLITALNAVLAQVILTSANRNLRPAGSFADMTLPGWMSWLLVVPAALSLVTGGEIRYIGHNLAVVAAIPFFFVGLFLVHRLARRAAFPGLILTVFYVALSVFGGAAIVVAALGVIDQWYGLEKHLGGPANDQESK